MTETLRQMRELLGPLVPLGEPTDHEREMVKPYEPPKSHPCEKCGEETRYSRDDVVNLHTREKIDEWDNRYFCRADYVPKHRLVVQCRNCEALNGGVFPLAQDTLPVSVCRMCGFSLGEVRGK